MSTLLRVENLHTYIGQYHILQGVSLEVEESRVPVVLGRNGAGKTTTLKTIMGITPARQGSILFRGEEIRHLETYRIAQKGIGYVPEEPGIFSDLTVEENLRLAVRRNDSKTREKMDAALELFPDLKAAWRKRGGTLSGGQKQMLALARAFVNDNRLLLIDEPSKGLAPVVVEKVMEAIRAMKNHTTIVLVEQNFVVASGVGDDVYILDDGRTVYRGSMADLRQNDGLKRKYLGIGV